MGDLVRKINKKYLSLYEMQKNNSVIKFVDNTSISGNNQKYMKMYNWMSSVYDFSENIVGKLKYKNEVEILRCSLMSKIEWKNNLTVLYVSIGTGQDLRFIPDNINLDTLDFVGIDLSLGMLRKCRKNYKSKTNITLINCNAEELPFVDDCFDIVFHVGGINFFNNIKSAINEMVRVAKPGCKILIADETQDFIESQYKKNAFTKKHYAKEIFDLSKIEKCIPENVIEKNTELLWNNQFYAITFRK